MLSDHLKAAQLWLESNLHPAAPWALLTVGLWLSVFCVRKYLPEVWIKLERIGPQSAPASVVFQSLPTILAGALAGVYLSGGAFGDAWKGALSGAVAPLLHHLLKASPLPYQGARSLTEKDLMSDLQSPPADNDGR